MFIPEDIYRVVRQSMPIPCVDLVILDQSGRVLLLKRANYPAQGQWWFPGGRVHFLEARQAAALRKLKEECNLDAAKVTELGGHDVIITGQGMPPSHSITALFLVNVDQVADLRLDRQSQAAEWRGPQEWLAEGLHPFITSVLRRLTANEINLR